VHRTIRVEVAVTAVPVECPVDACAAVGRAADDAGVTAEYLVLADKEDNETAAVGIAAAELGVPVKTDNTKYAD
jgi:hypothetical protein